MEVLDKAPLTRRFSWRSQVAHNKPLFNIKFWVKRIQIIGGRYKQNILLRKNWHNFETNDNYRLGQVVKKHSCSSRCWFSRFGVSFSQGWRLCGRSPICFLRNTYSRHRQTCWASEKQHSGEKNRGRLNPTNVKFQKKTRFSARIFVYLFIEATILVRKLNLSQVNQNIIKQFYFTLIYLQ